MTPPPTPSTAWQASHLFPAEARCAELVGSYLDANELGGRGSPCAPAVVAQLCSMRASWSLPSAQPSFNAVPSPSPGKVSSRSRCSMAAVTSRHGRGA
ncbi:hypothetical protein E2562_020639 [Oryza meyeriana var. granulata]|uniref:Uncharacterized protein n=1 Tax=Oryza meyeriana var. granulata TaxID=110450 RepID=A0A6G1EC04_9ORYZ|nr:hypothetical protein E2562_020639 [Oryza meyeriana var. granulata]